MHKIGHYFGRRGGVLFLFGLAWVALGINILVNPTQRFSADVTPPEGGLFDALDSPLFGIMWIIGGAVALVNALIRRRIDNEDAIGYVAAIFPTLVWLSFHFTSSLTFAISGGEVGRSSATAGITIYAVLGTVLLLVSGWQDPTDTKLISNSKELALLDQFDETHDENKVRGNVARQASEAWIQEARRLSEESIQRSATENDRRILSEKVDP